MRKWGRGQAASPVPGHPARKRRCRTSSCAPACSGCNSGKEVLTGPLESRQPLGTTFFYADVRQQTSGRQEPGRFCHLPAVVLEKPRKQVTDPAACRVAHTQEEGAAFKEISLPLGMGTRDSETSGGLYSISGLPRWGKSPKTGGDLPKAALRLVVPASGAEVSRLSRAFLSTRRPWEGSVTHSPRASLPGVRLISALD